MVWEFLDDTGSLNLEHKCTWGPVCGYIFLVKNLFPPPSTCFLAGKFLQFILQDEFIFISSLFEVWTFLVHIHIKAFIWLWTLVKFQILPLFFLNSMWPSNRNLSSLLFNRCFKCKIKVKVSITWHSQPYLFLTSEHIYYFFKWGFFFLCPQSISHFHHI